MQRPNTQIADWMATALEALSQESDAYTYIVTRTKSSGALRVILQCVWAAVLRMFADNSRYRSAGSTFAVCKTLKATWLVRSIYKSRTTVRQSCNICCTQRWTISAAYRYVLTHCCLHPACMHATHLEGDLQLGHTTAASGPTQQLSARSSHCSAASTAVC